MKTKRIFFITFMILLKLSVSSQENNNIIYTVFDPDYNIYNTSCVEVYENFLVNCDSIDINHDGIWDINFWYAWSSVAGLEPKFRINHVDNMRACYICDQDEYEYLSEFNYNITGGSYMDYSDLCDVIALNHEYKMGFRKAVNGGWCYGWLRCTVILFPSYGGCTFKLIDMAYCTIPDYPLVFGQTEFMDIDENEYDTSDARLFPNPAEDRLSLQLSEDVSCMNVEIYGIDGRLLKSQNDNFENIDVSGLCSGIYIAKIYLEDGTIVSKKIVKR